MFDDDLVPRTHDDDVHQLVLDPIDAGIWRLSDRAVRSTDPGSVVACVVQSAEDVFDVTWIDAGVGHDRYRRLEDVLRGAVAHIRDGGTRGLVAPFG